MKGILISIITIIIMIGITGYILVSDRLELAKERIDSPVHVSRSDSTITIAVIGDSWAAYSMKYHFNKMIDNELLHYGIKASTLISGMPGAKTSQIYCNMFDDSTEVGTKKNHLLSPSVLHPSDGYKRPKRPIWPAILYTPFHVSHQTPPIQEHHTNCIQHTRCKLFEVI